MAEARAADLAQVREALESDDRILLSADSAIAWLRALNLLRLALAERVGISTDGWEEQYTMQEHRRPPWPPSTCSVGSKKAWWRHSASADRRGAVQLLEFAQRSVIQRSSSSGAEGKPTLRRR